LDGVGHGLGDEDDAWATARTPVLDRLLRDCPATRLKAHGVWAGLPSNADMGNSEVGHNAMGAGRVFDQGAKLVDQAIATGRAFESDTWTQLISGGTLHLLGLLSDGNVHSHIDHVFALIERAAADGVQRLRVHLLTDGRDVEGRSALTFIEPLQQRLQHHRQAGQDYRIASGGGRMHLTMDRYEGDWDMVARGWQCHVQGQGRHFASASDAVHTLYAEDAKVDDQWLPAFVVAEDGRPVGPIEDGDTVLFFNFRGDRSLEITRAFEADSVPFDRGHRPDVFFAGMMQYDGDLLLPTDYLVAPPAIDRVAAEYLAAAGLPSLAISETHKFGHVTYFFNGNRSEKVDPTLEDWVEIPSDTGPLEERPWMKAAEVTDAVVQAIGSGRYAHIRLNLANGDMVGHTGHLEATRVALEAVDLCVGRLEAAVTAHDGLLLVTADHGNADEMFMRKGGQLKTNSAGVPIPRTSHSLNEVPFIVVDPRHQLAIVPTDQPRGLASIATTLLELCGLQAPEDYAPGLVVPADQAPTHPANTD
jgi:2,3-bisphosphoglycerate-independent phosphoglycerate mutase